MLVSINNNHHDVEPPFDKIDLDEGEESIPKMVEVSESVVKFEDVHIVMTEFGAISVCGAIEAVAIVRVA